MLAGLPIEQIFEWVGYFGIAFYIGSYVALQTGAIPGVGYSYAMLNLIGASLVLISLTFSFNMPIALIQVLWITVSLIGILRIFLIRRRLHFSNEEELFRRAGLPGVPPEITRKILDGGEWKTLKAGEPLTQEGQPVQHLYFMSNGTAGIFVMGTKVAELHEGFIGELNVMEAGPASATVETLEKSRVFCVSGEMLRRLTKLDTQASLYIETHLSTSTKQKLMQANLQLSASRGS